VIVGFIAFLMVLRAISLVLVSTDNNNINKKGQNMEKTKIVTSAVLETVWAIGVGIIVGQLST